MWEPAGVPVFPLPAMLRSFRRRGWALRPAIVPSAPARSGSSAEADAERMLDAKLRRPSEPLYGVPAPGAHAGLHQRLRIIFNDDEKLTCRNDHEIASYCQPTARNFTCDS